LIKVCNADRPVWTTCTHSDTQACRSEPPKPQPGPPPCTPRPVILSAATLRLSFPIDQGACPVAPPSAVPPVRLHVSALHRNGSASPPSLCRSQRLTRSGNAVTCTGTGSELRATQQLHAPPRACQHSCSTELRCAAGLLVSTVEGALCEG